MYYRAVFRLFVDIGFFSFSQFSLSPNVFFCFPVSRSLCARVLLLYISLQKITLDSIGPCALSLKRLV